MTRVLPLFLLLAACAPDRPPVYASAQNPAAAYCQAEAGVYAPGPGGGTCTVRSGETYNADQLYRARTR